MIKKPVKIAVLGCVVNGPGEASEADIGIAAGKGVAILYRKGRSSETSEGGGDRERGVGGGREVSGGKLRDLLGSTHHCLKFCS